MKLLHTTIVVLALAGAGAAAWWLQNRPPVPMAGSGVRPAAGAAGAGPVAVEVATAELTRLEDDAQAVGSLRALQGVMLRPEVSGRVVQLGFADGQRVRKDQLLVQLDDSLQQAQLQQARAQARIAATQLQRNRELVAQNFVSRSVLDQAQATLEVAQAQVALALAQLQRMRVLAPFDGIAGIRNVSLGDYVKDGADLVQVEDVSSVWVDFRLPERHLPQLARGQAVAVTLDALPGRRYSARVEAIDAQLDASGRSLLVRARLANPGGALRTGLFARTRIVFDVREHAVTVPEEALVPQGDAQYLIKVVDGPGGATLGQRIVARLGLRVPGRVEVIEGLQPGDRVVVAGQARLMRGAPQPLRIVQIAGPGAAPGAARSGPTAAGAASSPGVAASAAAGPAAPAAARRPAAAAPGRA